MFEPVRNANDDTKTAEKYGSDRDFSDAIHSILDTIGMDRDNDRFVNGDFIEQTFHVHDMTDLAETEISCHLLDGLGRQFLSASRSSRQQDNT